MTTRRGDGSWIKNEGAGPVWFWLLLVAVLATNGADAAIRYVTPGGVGDCSSWASSCDLQTALGAASASDQIWVAAGTYTPGNARSDSFNLVAGVEIYGGFSGGESSLGERDWVVHETVLSGDIGVGGDPSDNSYHVVRMTLGDPTAVLDGFTVTAGRTPNTFPDYYGGGFYGNGGGATLRNLSIHGNRALNAGAGIYIQDGDLVVENSVIDSNSLGSVEGDGCGIFVDNSTLLMTHVTISRCIARIGGGVNVSSGSADLSDVRFEGCWANARGGGIATGTGSSLSLTRVTFIGNTGTSGGGVASLSSAPGAVITDVDFIRNHAGSRGGGMINEGNAEMTNVRFLGNSAGTGGGLHNYQLGAGHATVISNALFVGNTSLSQGGGFYNEVADDGGDSMHLLNATFVANHANLNGGGFHNWGQVGGATSPDVLVANSIFRDNTAQEFDSQIESAFDVPTVVYSDVQGGYGGTAIIDVDPSFIRPPNPGIDLTWGTEDDYYGDLRVTAGSPVIDAGDSGLLTATIALGRTPRTVDDPGVPDTGVGSPPVDMGPYEHLGIFADGFESGSLASWEIRWPREVVTVVTPVDVVSTSEWSTNPYDGRVVNLINGSGLSGVGPVESQTHDASGDASTMWHSGPGDGGLGCGACSNPPPVGSQEVVFDLGTTTTLVGAHVWNHNQASLTDRGVWELEILVSADSDPLTASFDSLGMATLLVAGGGAEPSQLVSFRAAGVRLVKFAIMTHYGASPPYVGLSEVRFLREVSAP